MSVTELDELEKTATPQLLKLPKISKPKISTINYMLMDPL
jgi:hypothetical protein